MFHAVERWMQANDLSSVRVLDAVREVDPAGVGISRRTLFNVRRKGTCDSRTLILLCAASDYLDLLHTLDVTDFDLWKVWPVKRRDGAAS